MTDGEDAPTHSRMGVAFFLEEKALICDMHATHEHFSVASSCRSTWTYRKRCKNGSAPVHYALAVCGPKQERGHCENHDFALRRLFFLIWGSRYVNINSRNQKINNERSLYLFLKSRSKTGKCPSVLNGPPRVPVHYGVQSYILSLVFYRTRFTFSEAQDSGTEAPTR